MLDICGPKAAAEDYMIMAGDAALDFPGTAPAASELKLSMPVICGLRYCMKALPLKIMGSVFFEWEIRNSSADFADAAWTLDNPVLVCDLLEAPEAQQAIERRILSGSSIPIVLSSFFYTMTSITPDSTVNISRNPSKLKRVFVSYTAAANDSAVDVFRHPTGAFSFQMRISSKMVPENAIEDDTTAFYHLHKALGSHKDATRSINIDKAGYAGTKYLLCLSTEKLEGEPWSGTSLSSGDLVNLQIKNAGGVGLQYAVLEHELALSLGEVNEILQ